MENKSQILNELRPHSPSLADAAPGLPYGVPAGYFEQLPELVLDRLQASAGIPRVEDGQSFRVPQGYFESLAGNILEKIRQSEGGNEVRTELEAVAPLLNTISKANVFELPAGYFDQLQVRIPARPAKVVAMRKMRGWMQYVAAGVISGVLITGAFLYTDNNNVKEINSAQNMDVSSELNKVSAGELVKYFETPDHVQLASNDPVQEVKHTIETVSDEELGQYLNEHPDESIVTVTN